MKIGFIGLGKMGSRMCLRLLEKKHKLVLYARHPSSMNLLVEKGATGTQNYAEFAKKLGKNKIILLMVPHGSAVDEVLSSLLPFLQKGDIIIDAGNSHYKDSIKRGKELASKGIDFLDAGTSGGLEGARNGASIMVGGSKSTFKKCEPIFKALAVKNGYGYMGQGGCGHFVKMVHNGMEYSLMQSYGEGYELLAKGPYKLDLREVTRVYKNGSVIRSWLVDLLSDALKKDPELKSQSGIVGGGSTGSWTLEAAREFDSKMPMLELAMDARQESFKKQGFATKVVAALRFGFGGHEAPKKGGEK
ncbi:MAG: decarboxylating 6-phosphogluconate dehydrogenase [archaeon]|nr:decarboxylating 6-phosphogluconate dehydrogenase [archaeon]